MSDTRAGSSAEIPTFCIVTPVFNGRDYIDETISSILSQVGPFKVHYHVQDGGSTDGTLERVAYWQELAKTLPINLAELTFTVSSEPDSGMYDAINKGYAHALPAGDDVVMGWIAADDKIAPGGFAAIHGIRRRFPEVRFLGGRVSLLDETGSVIAVHGLQPFNQRCIAAGLNDGRTMPFIMQEGTFWCADLWRKVGGLDSSMRLAGDWDLWRRMAWHEEYFVADSVLGFHRRRPGQLSEHMDKYYAEVDGRLDAPVDSLPKVLLHDDITHELSATMPSWREVSAIVERQHQTLLSQLTRFRDSAHATTFLKYNLALRDWEKPLRTGDVGVPRTTVEQSGTGVDVPLRLVDGFGASEGPYPEFGMHRPIRWIVAPTASASFDAPVAGDYSVRLACRNWEPERGITIRCDGRPITWLDVPQLGHDSDILLQAEVTLEAGPHLFEIAIDGATGKGSYLLVESWRVALLPVRRAGALLPRLPMNIGKAAVRDGRVLPRISIVIPTRNQAHFIRDTLASLVRQNYPNLEIIVVDGASTDETLAILDDFAAHITTVISEPDTGQSNAINKGLRKATGDILSWLNSDDLLADGALFAVAQTFTTRESEIVVGGCQVFGRENRVLHTHWPCIQGDTLEAEAVLDIENAWIRGKFFHQPEVFFARSLWEAAGGAVDEDLYYSMDFDLWVRMGRLSPRLSIIGAVLACFRMHEDQKTSTVEAYRPELTSHARAWRQKIGLDPMPEPVELRHKLRITFFNDVGFKYGAGIAHRRLALAAQAAGHEVTVLAYADLDRGRPDQEISDAAVAAAIAETIPDLVIVGNLHAIRSDCDLLGELVAAGIPTLFYAHDHWVATGRCGYPGACDGHLRRCDAFCPTAESYPALPRDRVGPAFDGRRQSLAPKDGKRLTIATNSNYMVGSLAQSLGDSAPPIDFVPLGIDVEVFAPGQRWRSRQILDLPRDRFIIATSATSLADPRKDLKILLEAISGLPDLDNVMLLVMGFGEPVTDLAFDVRYTGYLADELLIASYLQATDLFVGTSREEAFGQTIVEAAACGIPSVAFETGGISETIIDDVTGVLIPERSVDALTGAIAALRSDPSKRERLGEGARIHAINRFSKEASAAALMALLAASKVLDLKLVPTVVLTSTPPDEVKAQYLTFNTETNVAVAPTEWRPDDGFVHELGDPDNGGFTQFWWATYPAARFFLRSASAGRYLIDMTVQCPINDQTISVRVNDGSAIIAAVPPAPFTETRSVVVPVVLRAGYNRIDINFGQKVSGEDDERSLGILVRGIDIVEDGFAGEATPHDGAFKLGTGFGPEEGPYPDHGIDRLFHWALGRRSQLRFYNASTSRRTLSLRLRSHLHEQQLLFYIDGDLNSARVFHDGDMATERMVEIGAELGEGFHTMDIVASKQSANDEELPGLAWLFHDLQLDGCSDFVAPRDAIDWDNLHGFGPEHEPLPLEGYDRAFRWAYEESAALVIKRASGGTARLRIEYRLPDNALSAAVTVNGNAAGIINFGSGSLLETRSVTHLVSLLPGENIVRLDYYLNERAGRQGFLLLEGLFLDDETEEAAEKSVVVSRGFRWIAEEGFSYREGAVPEAGVLEGFRWCLSPEARVRFDRPVAHAVLHVRNIVPGQQLTIYADLGEGRRGDLVGQVTLAADISALITVPLGAAEPFDAVIIECSKVPLSVGDDHRSLCYMLVGVTADTSDPEG